MTAFLSAATARTHFERYLKPREERQLLAHIAKHSGVYAQRDHAWIRLARHCGFRLGSLRHLTVGDAKRALRDRLLRARPEHAKRGNGYDIPVNSKAEIALRDALRVRRAMHLPDDDDAPLFTSREGGALSERSFQHNLQKWRTSAGLAVEASPHWLRHTFAKRVHGATEHRDPQGVVQALLGQKSRQSTVIYTLPDRSDLESAVEAACR